MRRRYHVTKCGARCKVVIFFDKMRDVRGSLRKHSAMVPVRTLAIAFAVLAASAAAALADDKPVEIPLKDVWALGMSGTKDIHQLEPNIFKDINKRSGYEQRALHDNSYIGQLEKTLGDLPDDKKSDHGFAVSGVGREALRNAAVARLNDLPQQKLSANRPVTVVFFSHESGGTFTLEKITRTETRIRIECHVKVRETMDLQKEFALIPLGKLSPGKYSVDIVLDEPKKMASKSVCRPFTFTVEER